MSSLFPSTATFPNLNIQTGLNVQNPNFNVQPQLPNIYSQGIPGYGSSLLFPNSMLNPGTWTMPPSSQSQGVPGYGSSPLLPGSMLSPGAWKMPLPSGGALTGVSPWETAAMAGIAGPGAVGATPKPGEYVVAQNPDGSFLTSTGRKIAARSSATFPRAPTTTAGRNQQAALTGTSKTTQKKYLQGLPGDPTGLLTIGPDAATGGAAAPAASNPMSVFLAGLAKAGKLPAYTTPTITAGAPLKASTYTYQPLDPKSLSYMPTGSALQALLPNYLNPFGPKVQGVLNAGLQNYLTTLGASKNDLAKFQQMIQNLPSLAPQALAIARGELAPQAASARQSGLQTANFIRLLGQATAGIQNETAGTIGRSYTNSAQTLSALAQAVGGGLGAGMAAQVAGTPQNPLAPSVQPTGLPGGLDIRGVPAGAFTGVPGGPEGALPMIQGTLPATSLTNQGPFATAADASLANVIMGGARQQSLMALAQGNQNVARIMAQLPQFQQQALQQLTTERNADLDRRLQLLTASGQITGQQAQAIWENAQTQAQGLSGAISGLNTWNQGQSAINMQNIGTNVQTENAAVTAANTGVNAANQFNVGQQNEVNRAQAQLNVSIATANAQLVQNARTQAIAQQQRSIANYLAAYKIMNPASSGVKPMTAAQVQSTRKDMTSDLINWSQGSKGKSVISVKALDGTTKLVRVPAGQPIQAQMAWLQFKTKYGDFFSRNYGNPMNAMLAIFRPYYRIPYSWGDNEITNNSGLLPSGGTGFGLPGQASGFAGNAVTDSLTPQPGLGANLIPIPEPPKNKKK